MEFSGFFYGVSVSSGFFLAAVFALVIPPILASKGGKYKKYIKFIAPLSLVVFLVAVFLRIFLEETQWGVTSQPPYFVCSPGSIQLIFFILVIYFFGVLFLEYLER